MENITYKSFIKVLGGFKELLQLTDWEKTQSQTQSCQLKQWTRIIKLVYQG